MDGEKKQYFATGVVVGLLIFGTALVYVAWLTNVLRTTLSATVSDVAQLQASSTEHSLLQEEQFSDIENRLVTLSDQLYAQQQRSDRLENVLVRFEDEFGTLSGSVETLEKLSTTDPELLQKYSRVFFLNEHYMPADLTIIDEEYDYPNGKEVSVHSDVWPFLEDMIRDASRDDISLMVLSGYRSFAEQTTLKQNYTVQYGSGANQFSADQGYSEHQLGTTVDLTTPELGEQLELFDTTDAYEWLQRNAYKYGFVLSYPEGNSYYSYEPWHWRFVGKDLARTIRRKDTYFYDMEQREIDSYLAELFDR